MEQNKDVRATMPYSALTGFISGIAAPFTAFGTIGRVRGLKRYFIIPFILNIFLLTGIFICSYYFLDTALTALLPQDPAWYWRLLRLILSPLIIVFLVLCITLVYSITGSIITAPFNDFISEKIEIHEGTIPRDEPFSFAGFIGDFLRALANMFRLILFLILFNIMILFINIIPLAGSAIYSILSFCAAMFFLGFQFFDYPLERRKMKFREKRKILWKHKAMVIGLGMGFFIISFIPMVGFLGLNLATIGATELFITYIRDLTPLAPLSRGEKGGW